MPAPLLQWSRDSQDVPLCKARGVPLLLDSSSCRVSALCLSSAPPPLLPSLRASKKCETLNVKPSFYWKDMAVPLRLHSKGGKALTKRQTPVPTSPTWTSEAANILAEVQEDINFCLVQSLSKRGHQSQCSPKQGSAAGVMVQEAEARLDTPTTAAILMAPRLHLHAT